MNFVTEDVSREESHERAADTFRGCLDSLADLGVTLCMEPLTEAETNFVTTCAEGLELVERVSHPNLVLHLDVKAMSAETTPVPELIRRYAPRAGHFHANDANLQGPGFGEVDFVPIFEALRDVGYQGFVTLELYPYVDRPVEAGRESFRYLLEHGGRAGS